jgi:hypothetical protein
MVRNYTSLFLDIMRDVSTVRIGLSWCTILYPFTSSVNYTSVIKTACLRGV